MTQPALSRLETGGVIPTIPLLERISVALDADLIVQIASHAACPPTPCVAGRANPPTRTHLLAL
jgi:hypothetical protein